MRVLPKFPFNPSLHAAGVGHKELHRSRPHISFGASAGKAAKRIVTVDWQDVDCALDQGGAFKRPVNHLACMV